MFLHPYLLLGLGACAVPVVLHLLNRQKPKRLVFPAFRFLLQRRATNQNRMRIRNILLMVLRVVVLAALVFALARPRLFAGPAGTLAGRDARVVLLIDTSPSMEYAVAGVSRLDEARSRAKELLDALAADSRAAVLDSGDLIDEPFVPLADARARLDRLAIRPGAGGLNRAAERGLDLLVKERRPDGPALALYAFTDRTRAAWDPRGTTPKQPTDVAVRIVDVGVPSPRGLGIESVELVPPVVAPGAGYQVRVRLRGTPTGHDTSVSCKLDAEEKTHTLPVQMAKGIELETAVFERAAPVGKTAFDVPLGLRVFLGKDDGKKPFNHHRHATLVVRGGRRMLTLVSSPKQAGLWPVAQDSLRHFTNETLTFAEADRLDLAGYAVVAVCQADAVPAGWWPKLEAYARNGGGVAVIPGGDEVALASFGADTNVLPAALEKLEDAPKGGPVYWERFAGAHPLMAPFVGWTRKGNPDFGRPELQPFVRRYWRLGPLAKGAEVVTPYAAPGRPAALAERRIGKGRVVLFTTPLDARWLDEKLRTQWTNYWDSSFGIVMIDLVSRHLAGEEGAPALAFPCGQEVALPLPSPLAPPYTLDGPALGAAERAVKTPPAGGDAIIPQARQPGNFAVKDGKGQAVAGFSLDVPSREGDLTRIEAKGLEDIFGAGCVAEPGKGSLKDALTGGRASPVELLPWLMMGLLAFMAGEGLLANRYYSTPPEGEEKP